MLQGIKKRNRSTELFIFATVAALTFFAGSFTVAPGLGPGAAAAWAASALHAGDPISGEVAPLFVFFVKITGALFPAVSIASALNWITLVGYSLAMGMFTVPIYRMILYLNVWAPSMVAIWLGIFTGIAKTSWATALMVNPATWSFLFLTIAVYIFSGVRRAFQGSDSLRIAAGMFFTGIAATMHVGALLAVPALLAMLWCADGKALKRHRSLVFIWVLIPITLLTYPLAEMIHPVRGILVGSPGIPDYRNALLPAWSIWTAATPIALLPAIWGVIQVAKWQLRTIVVILALYAGGFIGGFLGGEYAEFGAFFVALETAFLAGLGLVLLFRKLPGGTSMLVWLIIPVLWGLTGTSISRSNETIWEIHAKNTLRTVRLNTFVLSTDETLANAPYAYLAAAQRMRVDLTVLNPLRFDDARYLGAIRNKYADRFGPVLPSLDSLLDVADNPEVTSDSIRAFADIFISRLVDTFVDENGGVMFSPQYIPPVDGYPYNAEGLFMRIQGNSPPMPFHFSGLRLDDIEYYPGMPLLQQRAVAMYPMMFTMRGSWMISEQYHAEGFDYIRWALLIDPQYTPARIVAREFNIQGMPQRLGQ